jgi:predicted NAD/FAD-binding protein
VCDVTGKEERFNQVILATPTRRDDAGRAVRRRAVALGSVRYESELHNHAVVHTDGSVLPYARDRNDEDRATVLHYGAAPTTTITYIMHNQQPWRSGPIGLVTYNPIQRSTRRRWWRAPGAQHVVHDVPIQWLLNVFPFLQGKRRTWYCGDHTTVNSQEHCFISGMTVARQLGADYPFSHNKEAAEWFNFYGRLMHGPLFRGAET